MYSLPVPITTASDAYAAAVNTIMDTARRTTFANAAQIVHDRCDAFDALAVGQRFAYADGADFEVEGLGTHKMSDLYDKQFARTRGTKAIRDSIKNAAPHDLCPYCGAGRAAQLDHYLPKEKFHGTAVYPANLVPACGECNVAKLDYSPSATKPAVLHPYFDTAFDTPWLVANLLKSDFGPPVIDFAVNSLPTNPELEGRLNAHMNVFKLRSRFGVWGAQCLNNFERMVRSESGPTTLQDAQLHLQRMAVQESGGRTNSCAGAAYKAMRESDWYLSSYLKLT